MIASFLVPYLEQVLEQVPEASTTTPEESVTVDEVQEVS